MLKLENIFVILFCIFKTYSATFETERLCLNPNDSLMYNYKIQCDSSINEKIFITQVIYENDYDDYCLLKLNNDSLIENNLNETTTYCSATNTNIIKAHCDGKHECDLNMSSKSKLNRKFKFGIDGSNCNFNAERLFIRYNCINDNYKDDHIIKYDICQTSTLDFYPNEAFILSPKYPYPYNRRSYCQMKINFNKAKYSNLELYLIDLHLEKPSLITGNPTDYLEIDGQKKYFGDYTYEMLFNGASDVLLTFKTDNFFNKRGFLIYLKAVNKPITTTTIATITTTTTTTTTPITTTTTTTTIEVLEDTSFSYENDTSNNQSKIISKLFEKNYVFAENLVSSKSQNVDNGDSVKFIILVLLSVFCAFLAVILIYLVFKTRNYKKNVIKKREIKNSTSSNSESSTTTRITIDSTTFTPYTDDSIAHLLLVNANSTFIQNNELVDRLYEDLTDIIEDKSQNIYSDDPVERNQYCYITEKQIQKMNKEAKIDNDNNTEENASFYLNDPLIHDSILNETKAISNETIAEVIENTEDYEVPSNKPIIS